MLKAKIILYVSIKIVMNRTPIADNEMITHHAKIHISLFMHFPTIKLLE